MHDRSRNRPRDPNQLAKAIIAIATGEQPDPLFADAARSAASALGRLGGLKGGRARAEKLSSKQRKNIARKAAAARWRKHDD